MSKKRPSVLHGTTTKLKTGCGNVYLTMNKDESNTLYEIALKMGKMGTCKGVDFFLLGVLLSSMIQEGVGLDKIKRIMQKHFIGCKCENPFQDENKQFITCYELIGKAIINEIESEEKQ